MNKKPNICRIAAVYCLLCVIGCSAADRVVKGRITSRTGNPVTDAVVYLEAYREGKGALDFGFVKIDSASWGSFSLKVRWKRSALLAYAIISPGMKTIAGFDRIHYYDTHDLTIELDSINSDEGDCEPRLLGMSFPFEKIPTLAERLGSAEYGPSLATIVSAFIPMLDGVCSPPSGYSGKLQAVRELRKRWLRSDMKRN